MPSCKQVQRCVRVSTLLVACGIPAPTSLSDPERSEVLSPVFFGSKVSQIVIVRLDTLLPRGCPLSHLPLCSRAKRGVLGYRAARLSCSSAIDSASPAAPERSEVEERSRCSNPSVPLERPLISPTGCSLPPRLSWLSSEGLPRPERGYQQRWSEAERGVLLSSGGPTGPERCTCAVYLCDVPGTSRGVTGETTKH